MGDNSTITRGDDEILRRLLASCLDDTYRTPPAYVSVSQQQKHSQVRRTGSEVPERSFAAKFLA